MLIHYYYFRESLTEKEYTWEGEWIKQAEINFVAGPESTITVNLIKNQLIDMQQKDKYI